MKQYDVCVVIWKNKISNTPNLTSGILLKEKSRHYIVVSEICPDAGYTSRTISKAQVLGIKRYGKIKLSPKIKEVMLNA